jgi:DeoR family fructose operon transcriptional repressor
MLLNCDKKSLNKQHTHQEYFLGKAHHLTERRQQIIETVGKYGQLSVTELSRKLDVSEVTIRHDLQALSDQGFLLRTRGSAVSTNKMPEFSFDVRQQQFAAQKRRIGKAASALVHNGDTIFLDASTTVHAIIPYLKELHELTVLTNSIRAAMSFLDSPHIQVILRGGYLRRESISVVGLNFDEMLSGINIQTGFFGSRGLTVENGLTDVNLNEVEMKRKMVASCRQVISLLDSRKWGKVAAYTFASLDNINTIITDKDAPRDLVKQIKNHQVKIILA